MLASGQSTANVGLFHCAASVIKMPGMNKNDNALILTAGHCMDEGSKVLPRGGWRTPDVGEILYNKKVARKRFILYSPGGNPLKAYYAGDGYYDHILLATMTGYDLAVFNSNISYAQMERKGVPVYQVATSLPKQTSPLIFTLWKDAHKLDLTCRVYQIVAQVREADWQFKNMIKLHQDIDDCGFRRGFSGAGSVDLKKQLIYGVASTAFSGGTPCEYDNPCEVDVHSRAISTALPQQVYATPAYVLLGCWDRKNKRFNVDQKQCLISKEANASRKQ